MRCSTNTFEEKTSLHPLTISFPPPPSGCPALPVGRSALPLFSINAATQRADFFGRPWDLVIPVAGGTPHEPQISPAVSAPHPRGNGLGLRRKRLRPRPERRQQFAVVTVENDGSLLHSNIFKEINYPSYSIPIPMAFSSRYAIRLPAPLSESLWLCPRYRRILGPSSGCPTVYDSKSGQRSAGRALHNNLRPDTRRSTFSTSPCHSACALFSSRLRVADSHIGRPVKHLPGRPPESLPRNCVTWTLRWSGKRQFASNFGRY